MTTRGRLLPVVPALLAPLTDATRGRVCHPLARRKTILASWLGFRGRVGCGASRYDHALLVEHVPDRCYGQPFTKRPLHTIGAEHPLGEHCSDASVALQPLADIKPSSSSIIERDDEMMGTRG